MLTSANFRCGTDVQPGAQSSIRLFNLSPDTKQASMSVGGKSVATGIAYSLGSKVRGDTSAPLPSGLLSHTVMAVVIVS